MNQIFARVTVFVGLLICGSAAIAQGFPHGPKYATVSATITPSSVAPGGHGKLVVDIAVASQFHIQSAHPSDPDSIPTVFNPTSVKSVSFGSAVFPADKPITTGTGIVNGYQGNVTVTVPFTVSSHAKAGSISLGGFVTYQGCNYSSCYPPKRDKVTAAVVIK